MSDGRRRVHDERRRILAMTPLTPACDACEQVAPADVAEDLAWYVDVTLTPDGPVQTIRCPRCW